MLLLTALLASSASGKVSPYLRDDDWWVSKEIGATNWGKWGEWFYCPKGTYAIKFQIKLEGDCGDDDDSAMTGVRFVCSDKAYSAVTDKEQSANTGIGAWRDPWTTCDEGAYLTGLQVWSEKPDQTDDSAAHNIWAWCTDPIKKETKYVKTKLDAFKDNDWKGLWGFVDQSDDDKCPENMAIVGFRSKAEPHGGVKNEDDTGFNRIQFVCRPLPICGHIKVTNVKLKERTRMIQDPSAFKKKNQITYRTRIGEIDNCDSGSPMTWSGTYTSTEEVTKTESYSSTESWEKTVGETMTHDVGFTVGFEMTPEVGVGGGLQFSWGRSISSSFEATVSGSDTKATSTSVTSAKTAATTNSFEVPPHNKWKLTTVLEAYKATVEYTATAQCYETSAMKNPVGEAKEYQGVYSGVAIARETIEVEDLSATCEHTCECAGVVGPHGGEECTAVWSPEAMVARGTWCYVYKGSCKNEEPLSVELDVGEREDGGFDPETFSWSKDPCVGKAARSRREMPSELVAPVY